jgi:CD109 antigen
LKEIQLLLIRLLKLLFVILDDKTYWKANHRVTKREVGDRALSNRAPSMDVEASSYALLAYMKLGYYAESFPIVKWLVSQRNPTGGQRSTQVNSNVNAKMIQT